MKVDRPKFKSEAEEAQWWDEHRDSVSRQFAQAQAEGKLRFVTKEKLQARLASRAVSIRINEADLALAKKQAEAKGLPYQTYIKSLLRETLLAREKQKRF